MRHSSLHRSLLVLTLCLVTSFGWSQEEGPRDEDMQDEDAVAAEDEEEVIGADEEEVVAAEPEKKADPTKPESTKPEEEAQAEDAIPEGIFAPGQEPWRAPAAGRGAAWGHLVDRDSGEPAIEAQIKVKQTGAVVLTDYEGYYRVELPPGKYDLEIFYEMYEPETLSGVVIQAGRVRRQDLKLKPQAGAIEELTIEEAAERATLEGQILRRQRSASAQDGVGRAEISRTPDSNAAEAAQRVVGATIVGSRFVYVRGLGERYTNALLHGAPLPSPDPNRAAVPLDIFPALVIDSININKTFTPDMPADFAGGSVAIETRDIPYKPVFSVTLKGAYNDQATFQNRLSYAGGGLDFLGADDGTRALPAGFPSDYPVYRQVVKPDGTRMSDAELAGWGKALNRSLVATGEETPVDHGVSIVGGNGWKLGKEARLGFIASANYDRSYQKITDGIERVLVLDQGSTLPRFDWNFSAGQDNVRWGLFGSTIFQANKDHSLRLIGMAMRNTVDRAQSFDGLDLQTRAVINNTRLSFVQQHMNLGQLRGEHHFPQLAKAELDYNLFLARATRDEPDTRDSVYNYADSSGPPYIFKDGSESGRHFYSGQFEDTYGGLLNWTQPLNSELHRIKFGGLWSQKERDFWARRFYYVRNPRSRLECPVDGTTFPPNCPAEHFTDENIDNGVLRLQEGTRTTDAFQSSLGVYAGYAQIDSEILDRLRLVAGARVEVTNQSARPVGQLGLVPDVAPAQLNDVDVLPAASLIYSATDKFKLRVSYGRTLARPQVRELAPFAFSDYFGGLETLGNPDLRLTRVHNFDTRVEFFPTMREVLAFSIFAKTFTDPIEPILRPAGDGTNVTFINTPAGTLIGVEAEARKGLGFLTPILVPFSIVTNVTLVNSSIQIDQPGTDTGSNQTFMTNSSRPMVQQAPVVFNVALDYQNEVGTSARILFNVSGARIVQVGTQGLPDAYEQSRPLLDFVLSQRFLEQWEARLVLENLLNSPILITQGESGGAPNVVRQYTTGRMVGLSLKYELQ